MLNNKPILAPNPLDVEKEVKKAWKRIKHRVDKAEIIHISVERKMEEFAEGLQIPEPLDTGIFEVKLRCREK